MRVTLIYLTIIAFLSILMTSPATGQTRALDHRVTILEEWIDEYEPGTSEGMVFGGALRFQYAYRDWDSGSRSRLGISNSRSSRLMSSAARTR